MSEYPYIWFWRVRLPERKGQRCRVLVRGRMNSILVEFVDGFKVVTSRFAVRLAEKDMGVGIMTDELKACPFCGSDATHPEAAIDGYVCCGDTGCNGWLMLMSIENWNTRPIEDALRKQVEELTEEVNVWKPSSITAQLEIDALQAKLAEYEGENKRWHSFETVQAIVKERDDIRKLLNHVEEMLDDWFDESGEYLSPISIREQITYIKSEIGLI